MLTLLSVWLLLSLTAAGAGLAVLGTGPLSRAADSREHGEDLLLLAAWLGLGLTAMAAFICVLFVPLNPAVSGLILAAAVLFSCWGWYRVSHLRSIREAWKAMLGTICILAIIVAERSTQVGNLDDAGGYHWSLIRWYRETGMPVGLGLFQWRLATHSSWLAFTALLDHGPMVSRTGNIANGLVLLWTLSHLFIVVARILRGSGGKAEIFVATAILLVLPGMMSWDMRLSPSPDIPVILLCILVSWAWLQFRSVAPPTSCVLPLLVLSAFAVTVKLSALPLLIFMTLIAIREGRREPLSWWMLALAAVLPTGALIAASLITTGCVMFPSPVLCFDTYWGVGADAARKYSEIVNGMAPRNITAWLIASGVALALVIVRRKAFLTEPDWGVAAIAAIGIGFTVYFAPTTRFGLGYLVLLPALALARYGPAARAVLARLPAGARTTLSAVLVVAIAIQFAFPLYKEFIYQKQRAREFESLTERKRGDASINAVNRYWYLVPNRVGYDGPFVLAKSNGFAYWTSARGNCWDRELPCASNPELSFIPALRLRDEAQGIRSGFTRRDRP